MIEGIDNKNENLTNWEWSICRIIPNDMVIPLLEMLEKTENPWAIPMRIASNLLILLEPFLKNFVIKMKTPLMKNPIESKKKS